MGRSIVFLALLGATAVLALDDIDSAAQISRVDAQVFNAEQIAIPGLQAADFVLSVDGKPQIIRNFAGDSAPLDILFLVDVGWEMKPSIQKLADMVEQAMHSLAASDRVGIMVFAVATRPVLELTSQRSDVSEALNRLAREERFLGGARITSSVISAASYLQRHARPNTRRAIVIMTHNYSEDTDDQLRVEQALQRADASLSFLFADIAPPPVDEEGDPIAKQKGKGKHKDTIDPDDLPQLKHGAPASPGHSGGSEKIAGDSGGYAASFDDEYVLEEMLVRFRHSYVLHFLPSGPPDSSSRVVKLDLTSAARTRFPDATVQSRLLYTPGLGNEQIMAPVVPNSSDENSAATSTSRQKKRTAVNEDTSVDEDEDFKPKPPER